MVIAWRNILSVCKQEPVKFQNDLFQLAVVVGQRQYDGQAARILYAVQIPGQHPYAVQLVIPKGHYADKRFSHSPPFPEPGLVPAISKRGRAAPFLCCV